MYGRYHLLRGEAAKEKNCVQYYISASCYTGYDLACGDSLESAIIDVVLDC
jgi:hypothetical protein